MEDLTKQEKLEQFTSVFGRSISNSPVIFPAFNNYYQDISVGGSRLGNLTKVNGEFLFPANGDPDKIYPDFLFQWFVNDVLVTTEQNPRLEDLKSDCSGVMEITLNILHLPTLTFAKRTEWAYLQYLDLPACNLPDALSQFEVFIPFFPDVDPVEEYMGLVYDYNNDGVVNAADLQFFLSLL